LLEIKITCAIRAAHRTAFCVSCNDLFHRTSQKRNCEYSDVSFTSYIVRNLCVEYPLWLLY